MPAHVGEIARDRAQRLVEAKCHVPGLAGEDGKDGRAFGAQLAARKKPQEKCDGESEKAQDGHGLQDIERRHDQQFGPAALGRQCGHDERKAERGEDSGEHPESRAQRISGQIPGIERHGGEIQLCQRRAYPAHTMANRHEGAGNQDEDDAIIEVGEQSARSKPQLRGTLGIAGGHRCHGLPSDPAVSMRTWRTAYVILRNGPDLSRLRRSYIRLSRTVRVYWLEFWLEAICSGAYSLLWR